MGPTGWHVGTVIQQLFLALLALGSTVTSGSTIQSISTGQELADGILAWGMRGDDTYLQLVPWVISLNSSTVFPNASSLPAPTGAPGQPFSSGHLIIQSASKANRSVLDAGMRANVIPYMQGTARFTLDSIIMINLCSLQLTHESHDAAEGRTRVATYTSALFVALFVNAFQVQSNAIQNVLAYTQQADIASTLYSVVMTRTPIPPLRAATTYRTEILTGSTQLIQYVSPYRVSLIHDPAVSTSTTEAVSLKEPADPLLQQLRQDGLVMDGVFCNGTALPDYLAQGDVDPSEGPLWLSNNTASFMAGLTAAADLAHAQMTAGGDALPPAVLLSGHASLAANTISGSTSSGAQGSASAERVWHVKMPLMVVGPFNDVPAYWVDSVLDLAGREGVFVLHPPQGQLAIQGLTLTGLLPVAVQQGSSSEIQSALPLAAITTATASSNVTANSSSNSTTDSNSSSNGGPIYMHNVTLVLPQADFLALAAVAVSGADGWQRASACLGPHISQQATYLQTKLTQAVLADAQLDQLDPSNLLLADMAGFGITATLLRVVPDIAITQSMPFKACLSTEPGSSVGFGSGSGTSNSSSSKRVHAGWLIGAIMGGLLVILAVVVMVVWLRRHRRRQLRNQVSSPKPPTLELKAGLFNSIATSDGAQRTDSDRVPAVQDHHGLTVVDNHPNHPGLALQQQRNTAHADDHNLSGSYQVGGSCSATAQPPMSRLTQHVLHAAQTQEDELASSGLLQTPQASTATPSQQPSEVQSAASLPATQQKLGPITPAAAAAAAAAPLSASSAAAAPSINPSSNPNPARHPAKDVAQLAAALQSSTADMVTVTGVLGAGASGTVYAGVWRGLRVALKTVVVPAGRHLERAVMEAAIAASVGHRNVVATYHHDIKRIIAKHDSLCTGDLKVDVVGSGDTAGDGSHGGSATTDDSCGYKLFLVQELCVVSLDTALEDGMLHAVGTGQVDQAATLQLLLDIAQGLQYLHSKGIVHGDLKPQNVLLSIDATTQSQVVAKLADFGLSVHVPEGLTHISCYTSGTPFYVAPEVVLHRRVSTASDMYGLGVLMWELYTGLTPWQDTSGDGPNHNKWREDFGMFHRPNIPPLAFVHIMNRCLAHTPAQRPTAQEVCGVLHALLEESNK